MKQITINPNNEPYYSEDFIKGFQCGAQRQFEADKSDADRPQGEWIPCEERLPEADGLYLATFTLIGIPKFSNVESFKNGKWEYHNGYIIAWQPLPKPWKGADDREDIQSEAEQ